MPLTKCTTNTSVIAGLGTTPQERGLTTEQFKAKFDEASTGIKDYINNTLTPEIDTALDGKVATSDYNTHVALTASETTAGHVELATAEETTAGTDNTRAVHPAGLKVELDKKLNLSGGTMTGILTAQNNTSYTTKQVRNITLSTADPSGGSDGDIWIKYTP